MGLYVGEIFDYMICFVETLNLFNTLTCDGMILINDSIN